MAPAMTVGADKRTALFGRHGEDLALGVLTGVKKEKNSVRTTIQISQTDASLRRYAYGLTSPRECWLSHVCRCGKQNKAQKMWLVSGLQDHRYPCVKIGSKDARG